MHWTNHISLHWNHHWQALSLFLLPGLTKRQNCRHTNSLLQHSYTSKLLTSKANSQHLLKMFTFEETLNKVLKQHRQQYRKIAIQFYKQKFSYKFCFSVFKILIFDPKNSYILTFTWHNLVSREEGQAFRPLRPLP